MNAVTAQLFRDCPTAPQMAEMTAEKLEEYIRPLGLFRTKAKNILETCRLLTETHNGVVPRTMEELVQLPGVGRKTAGVVLANAFGVPSFPVDTHVLRVSNRLGLSASRDPLTVEKDLTAMIKKKQWIDYHHRLISHGRQICGARKPKCQPARFPPVAPGKQA